MSFLKLVDLDALSRFKAKIMQLIPSAWAGSSSAGGPATIANGLHYGHVDSTSTKTAFTATIPGITEYYDGLTVILKNGVVTSASGFTLNINSLGAKGSYSNMSAATRDTTIFNVDYTMMFIYDSTRVDGGCWVCYRGYDSNSNSIGYQIRTSGTRMPASDKFYRYRLLFTSADGTKFIPANTSTSTNATTARTTNARPINPFGGIYYYGTTSAIDADALPSGSYMWQQYIFTLGYSFNADGGELSLTPNAPVYLRCTPQANGSAVMDYFTQALPSIEDNYIYIFLGVAVDATTMDLNLHHPVYFYKNGAIRPWTTSDAPSAYSLTPEMDGTASAGQSSSYARGDHVHPSDTSRLAANQGSANAGKFLAVGNDGAVVPVVAPSGRSEWTSLYDADLTEDIAAISFSNLDAKEIAVFFDGRVNLSDDSAANATATVAISINGTKVQQGAYCFVRGSGSKIQTIFRYEVIGGKTFGYVNAYQNGSGAGIFGAQGGKKDAQSIESIRISPITSGHLFKSGSHLTVLWR